MCATGRLKRQVVWLHAYLTYNLHAQVGSTASSCIPEARRSRSCHVHKRYHEQHYICIWRFDFFELAETWKLYLQTQKIEIKNTGLIHPRRVAWDRLVFRSCTSAGKRSRGYAAEYPHQTDARQPITSTFTNTYLNARLVQIPTLLTEGHAAVRWHRGPELTSVYGLRSVCSGAHYPAAWRLPLVAVAYDRWRFFLGWVYKHIWHCVCKQFTNHA